MDDVGNVDSWAGYVLDGISGKMYSMVVWSPLSYAGSDSYEILSA